MGARLCWRRAAAEGGSDSSAPGAGLLASAPPEWQGALGSPALPPPDSGSGLPPLGVTSVEVALRAGIAAGYKARGLVPTVPATERVVLTSPLGALRHRRGRNCFWVVVVDKDGARRVPPLVFQDWRCARPLVGDCIGGKFRLAPRAVHHAWRSALEKDAYLLGVQFTQTPRLSG